MNYSTHLSKRISSYKMDRILICNSNNVHTYNSRTIQNNARNRNYCDFITNSIYSINNQKTKSSVMDIVITCFGICYITLMLMFLSIIRGLNNGKFLIWYVFLASWLTDVFAYLTGKAVGKHHFTDISPNKTIEGCIGELLELLY